MLQHLAKEQVLSIVDYEGLIDSVSKALIKLHEGGGIAPPRFSTSIKGNWWGLMMGYVEGMGVGVKVVNLYPGNAAKGLETINGLVILFNGDDGSPLVTIDGGSLTGLRTAAASALSVKVTNASTKVLGFIGAGEQARYHALVFSRVFKVEEAYVVSRGERRLSEFLNYLRGLGINGHRASGVSEIIERCGTIIIATTSTTPVLNVKPRPGEHVISVGAPKPVVEIDRRVLEGADCVIADNREAVLNEAGEDLSNLRLIDLSEALTGEVRCTVGNGYTIYKSVGFSILDVAAAHHIYTRYTSGAGR